MQTVRKIKSLLAFEWPPLIVGTDSVHTRLLCTYKNQQDSTLCHLPVFLSQTHDIMVLDEEYHQPKVSLWGLPVFYSAIKKESSFRINIQPKEAKNGLVTTWASREEYLSLMCRISIESMFCFKT